MTEESDNHRATCRAVAKIASRREPDEAGKVVDNCPRATDETDEPRIFRPDKTPAHARYNEQSGEIAEPIVKPERLICDPVEQDCGGQKPMSDPNERVPDGYFCRFHLTITLWYHRYKKQGRLGHRWSARA